MTKGTTKQAPATPAVEKKTRTVLTPAQRIEKLKAEAEALEKREAERAAGKIADQEKRVAQLQSQVDDRQAKLDAAKATLAELERAAGINTDESTDES